jgi:hypothetical protein
MAELLSVKGRLSESLRSQSSGPETYYPAPFVSLGGGDQRPQTCLPYKTANLGSVRDFICAQVDKLEIKAIFLKKLFEIVRFPLGQVLNDGTGWTTGSAHRFDTFE